MLIESELRIQTVDGKKTDDHNFVIPPPKVFFKADLNYDEAKQTIEAQPKKENPNKGWCLMN
jgi:hypothetical protein